MSSVVRRRLVYVALALVTIAVGMAVHFRGSSFGPVIRDVLGDALWAAMIVWWVGAIAPRARPSTRYGVAYVICALVEISQLVHASALESVRATLLGQLILGSGFDPRDLLAYAVGVGTAAVVDAWFIGRRSQS